MRLRLVILLIGLTTVKCTVDKSSKSALVEADNLTDTVIQSIRTNNDLFTEIFLLADTSMENGTFNKMILKNGDKKVFEIHDVDAYDRIGATAMEIQNEVNSPNVLLQKAGDKYYLSLFGAEYGCCPRELTIIQADKNGVRKIFKDTFDVSKISKTDNGDIKYFGIESFSEALYSVDSLDILLFTYNPTLVYRLDDGFKFDSLTTKKYNEENYVFGGFNYQGELKVAFPKEEKERNSGTRKPYIYRGE